MKNQKQKLNSKENRFQSNRDTTVFAPKPLKLKDSANRFEDRRSKFTHSLKKSEVIEERINKLENQKTEKSLGESEVSNLNKIEEKSKKMKKSFISENK